MNEPISAQLRVMAMAILVTLAGCGQKGPLMLPGAEGSPSSAAQSSLPAESTDATDPTESAVSAEAPEFAEPDESAEVAGSALPDDDEASNVDRRRSGNDQSGSDQSGSDQSGRGDER